MIKILIAVILVIIMFLVNKMCMKKNKYFFPIIPFIISCVIIGISIFQIVQKENEYAADEIQPVAIINLTEDGSIVNYKLNSKYERYICGIKQKRIVALVISLQKRQSFYYFRLLINFIIKCYGIFLAHGIKCVCL